MDAIAVLREWALAHSTLPDDELTAADARWAAELGLPTLAALSDLAARLERAAQGRALLAEYVTPLLHVARGEATERLQLITGNERARVPGVGAVPKRLLERDNAEMSQTE